MKNKNLYIKNVISLFPIHSKKEREYLKKLKRNINEFDEDYPHSSYDEFVEKFGTPKDIFINYINNQNEEYLIKKIKRKKIMNIVCICILSFIIIIEFSQAISAYESYQESVEERGDNIEITAPEEISPDEV